MRVFDIEKEPQERAMKPKDLYIDLPSNFATYAASLSASSGVAARLSSILNCTTPTLMRCLLLTPRSLGIRILDATTPPSPFLLEARPPSNNLPLRTHTQSPPIPPRSLRRCHCRNRRILRR